MRIHNNIVKISSYHKEYIMPKPEKTYLVPRLRRDGWRPYTEFKPVLGKDLTDKDIAAIKKRHVKNTIRSVAGIGLGGLIIGMPGSYVPEADALAQLRTTAAADFSQLSFKDKFEALYLKPRRSDVASTVGGWGLLSLRSRYYAAVGQTCLVDTPYNTNPSVVRGLSRDGTNIPAPAVIGYDEATGEHVVSPYAGNETTMLRFKYTSGDLIPSESTIKRLLDNECTVVDGVYFGPSMVDGAQEGTQYNQALEPLQIGRE